MTTGDGCEIEQYFYRSVSSSNRHRNRVSAYFVQRFEGSKVVARIESLGLVHTSIGEEQLAIQRLRRNLVVVGSWQTTTSRHHARIRVAPATGSMQKAAPQSS
ncbi:MAG: hypothetical protein ABI298_00915 [Acidimicrobiales bacterium]